MFNNFKQNDDVVFLAVRNRPLFAIKGVIQIKMDMDGLALERIPLVKKT